MSEINPYKAPASDVEQPVSSPAGELTEPRGVPTGNGWGWLVGGFDLFRRGWLIWIVSFIIFTAIMIVLSVIPFLSIVGTILSPMFMGGLMAGCLALDQGDDLRVGHLFEGFQRNAGSLAAVGGLYLAGVIILAIVAGVGVAMTSFSMMGAGGELDPAAQQEMLSQMGPMMAIVILVVLALSIPLVMALWFAPALVMLHGIGAVEAMRLSFLGCLKNILPFLLYGVIALVFAILAVIPLALGFLILGPVIIASVYVGYKDIFVRQQ